MSVKYALLGILAEKPCHGYDLKRIFDERLGELWSLNIGQIYTTLDRLQTEGLVAHEEVAQSDRPDKKIYRLTDAGLEEFNDWRGRPIKAEPRSLRDELFIKLVFMKEDDIPGIQRLIQSQQSVYMAQMMRLTNRKFNIDQQMRYMLEKTTDSEARRHIEHERLMRTLLIDMALQHAEADIRWLRHCEAKLNSLYKTE